MDYPAGDGPLAGYQIHTFVPAARRRGVLRSTGRNRALAAALACLAAAVILGGIALSRSSGTAGGGDNAAPGQLPPGWLPHPSVTSPSPVTATTAPPDRARRTAGPGRRPATIRSRAAPVITPPPAPSAAVQTPAVQEPSVVVRYLVASQGPAGFQGEIQVTNNTAQPIGNWQVVVTLYDDAVTSFTNADGFFSNGILLLSPASPAQVAPPDGGVLDIFFTADGFQTIPAVCAFDGIDCGY